VRLGCLISRRQDAVWDQLRPEPRTALLAAHLAANLSLPSSRRRSRGLNKRTDSNPLSLGIWRWEAVAGQYLLSRPDIGRSLTEEGFVTVHILLRCARRSKALAKSVEPVPLRFLVVLLWIAARAFLLLDSEYVTGAKMDQRCALPSAREHAR
jgi:hypothetical protein